MKYIFIASRECVVLLLNCVTGDAGVSQNRWRWMGGKIVLLVNFLPTITDWKLKSYSSTLHESYCR